MVNFSKGKIFFFYPNCSDIKIIPNSLEHAYLCLLNNDLSSAKAIFSKMTIRVGFGEQYWFQFWKVIWKFSRLIFKLGIFWKLI